VPPFAVGRAVPLSVIAKVPVVVMGEPAKLKNAGTLAATLVTVPVPPTVVHVGASVVPALVKTCPTVPFASLVPAPDAPP